jgi:hypothetical protein
MPHLAVPSLQKNGYLCQVNPAFLELFADFFAECG